MLWQLTKLSTNEALNEPGPLPDNWGPIFGLSNIQDRLGDLSWLGEGYADQGWIQVEGETEELIDSSSQRAWQKAKNLLMQSDWTMLPDVPLTVEQKQKWIAYRKSLRDIRSQVGFPENIDWPSQPI